MGPRELLPNLRLGFACKESWDDMVGDDRVRACAGCNRDVFNLSAMTRAEAEALLATRGLKPCVRFYRRPDGTVMTSDCPSGVPRPTRRLAVVAASSLAAGTTLASASAAMADPAPAQSTPAADPSVIDLSADPPISIDDTATMGVPVDNTYDVEMGEMEMGEIVPVERPEQHAALEWSVWGRIAVGVASEQSDAVARRVTTVPPTDRASTTWEAAAAAEVTLGVAGHGDLRIGAWGELRTSSGPVAGGELVLEGLAPHPYVSRIHGAGSLVLRAGANDRIVTAALGFGYVGSWPRSDPWIHWARHVVGTRVILSFNRAIDEPRDWSTTVGLEVEPIGAVQALVERVTGH